MAQSSEELKEQLSRSLDQLKAIGDEIRSKVQDASKDAKVLWEQLEPRLGEVEKHFREAGFAARLAVDEIVKAVQAFGQGAEQAPSQTGQAPQGQAAQEEEAAPSAGEKNAAAPGPIGQDQQAEKPGSGEQS